MTLSLNTLFQQLGLQLHMQQYVLNTKILQSWLDKFQIMTSSIHDIYACLRMIGIYSCHTVLVTSSNFQHFQNDKMEPKKIKQFKKKGKKRPKYYENGGQKDQNTMKMGVKKTKIL